MWNSMWNSMWNGMWNSMWNSNRNIKKKSFLENEKNIALQKSFVFSIKIIELFKKLKWNNEFVISKQLLKSWTSIWANLMESKFWFSTKDFLYKISIALKEANETLYWIELLNQTDLVEFDYEGYFLDINELIALLSKSVITLKNKLNK